MKLLRTPDEGFEKMREVSYSKCILCGNNIDKQSIEHIIPENILGKLKSGRILCRNCNNKMGTEMDWVLQQRFKLILLGLNLCNIHKNKNIVADVSFKGEDYIFTKKGPRKKHPTVIKEGRKIIWNFSSERMARKELKKFKKKSPAIDVNEMIEKAERVKKDFDEPFDFVADAPLEETWRVCGKIIYEFMFLINPSYNPSDEKFKDFILGKIHFDKFPVCLYYQNYKPFDYDRNCIYHCIIIEGRAEEQLLIGYLEIFSCFKILLLLDSNYTGKSFTKGYIQNLMDMKRDYFNPIESIQLSKEQILNLIDNCMEDKYVYSYVESFYKSSFKARFYPLVELIFEIIIDLSSKSFSNKEKRYQYILDKFLNEFSRLGLHTSIVEGISEEHLEDTLLEKINRIIEYVLAHFAKLEMNIDIVEKLVKKL